jgi:DNA-binding protein H-NS
MARSPNVELEDMSDAQIHELIELARGVIGDRFSSRIDEWRSLAHEAGYELTVTKIGEGDGRRPRRRAESSGPDDRRGHVAAKYRNPDKASDEWSGRGRKPKWVEDKLASGKSLDDLLIHREPAEAEAQAGE